MEEEPLGIGSKIIITFSLDDKISIANDIKQTPMYEAFLYKSSIDRDMLWGEIEDLLNTGLSAFDLIQIFCADLSDEDNEFIDYDDAAKHCFRSVLENRALYKRLRLKSLKKDTTFQQTFDSTQNEIIRYVKRQLDDFPVNELKCLFVLADTDEQQGLIAQQMLIGCMRLYEMTTNEVVDLEKHIFSAMI